MLSFLSVELHATNFQEENRKRVDNRGGLQSLLLYRDIFLQFYPCALNLANMKAILFFFFFPVTNLVDSFLHMTIMITIL